jgi:hypothetical protein
MAVIYVRSDEWVKQVVTPTVKTLGDALMADEGYRAHMAKLYKVAFASYRKVNNVREEGEKICQKVL